MDQIILPNKVEYQPDPENKNKGQFIIEPCYPGYGITWGNALRRVLLSSLPGAAVDSIKIRGGRHEFSTLPHIKEDILQIVLNFKQLRLKLFKDEPVKLKLSIKGEKKATAADIDKSADVEIANPNLHLATLTDKKAEFDVEINVSRGFGYVPSEEKDRAGLEIGAIVMDSIFSPVIRVATQIEKMRVGQRTDYDRLSLIIETDGTIVPCQAFTEAADLLNSQFGFLVAQSSAVAEQLSAEEEKAIIKKPKTKKKAVKKKIAKSKKTK